jgi:hypothetical protein
VSLGLFFGQSLAVLAVAGDWTGGKALFFTFSAGLSFLGMFHLLALGIISEMVVGTSDLSHTLLPQIAGKVVYVAQDGKNEDYTSHRHTQIKRQFLTEAAGDAEKKASGTRIGSSKS